MNESGDRNRYVGKKHYQLDIDPSEVDKMLHSAAFGGDMKRTSTS
ncbi:MAG: hypothetical protein ACLR2G_08935 [Phascolarctobacterium faecium]